VVENFIIRHIPTQLTLSPLFNGSTNRPQGILVIPKTSEADFISKGYVLN